MVKNHLAVDVTVKCIENGVVIVANSGGADAEQRHLWNRCDGVHDGSISAPISIPFFQLI